MVFFNCYFGKVVATLFTSKWPWPWPYSVQNDTFFVKFSSELPLIISNKYNQYSANKYNQYIADQSVDDAHVALGVGSSR